MLYLHETHEVIGGHTGEFETAVRELWRPAVEGSGLGRLLWFWHHTHGTGASYQAVTFTAIPSWEAFGELAEQHAGSEAFAAWRREVWKLRREVVSKLMRTVSWSPVLPDPPSEGPANLYLHDTGWPYPGKLEEYVAALGSVYYPQVRKSQMISVEGCFTTNYGCGRFPEVVLLQKILNWEAFSRLLTEGERPTKAGEWMQEGLKYRDRWESKLLRPASWSPLR
jgi:hypothetical protein